MLSLFAVTNGVNMTGARKPQLLNRNHRTPLKPRASLQRYENKDSRKPLYRCRDEVPGCGSRLDDGTLYSRLWRQTQSRIS